MNLRKLILTENDCYKEDRKITPKGIMVHSTGANNPNLKRYVGPDDGFLGKNLLGNHWNQPRPSGKKVCVHAFIGKLKDGSIATYQTLPWDHRGWHAGGKANDTHIGFEICEDDLTDSSYFNAVYREAVELCAYLCRLHNLSEKDIIGHYEGHQKGIASNHSDPEHWFIKHGKSMKSIRAEVGRELEGKGGEAKLFQRTSRFGMEGSDVGVAQRLLKALGFYTGPIDEKFGPGQGFLNAVKAFQKANGLAVDGVIGPKTQAKMLEIMLQRVEQPIEDTNALQAEVSSLKNRIRKYEDYFRLQNELSKGV